MLQLYKKWGFAGLSQYNSFTQPTNVNQLSEHSILIMWNTSAANNMLQYCSKHRSKIAVVIFEAKDSADASFGVCDNCRNKETDTVLEKYRACKLVGAVKLFEGSGKHFWKRKKTCSKHKGPGASHDKNSTTPKGSNAGSLPKTGSSKSSNQHSHRSGSGKGSVPDGSVKPPSSSKVYVPG